MRLTGLYVYPVKSARGIALDLAEVDRFGIQHDRRFMLVDPDGRFVTQREAPKLALAIPRIETHGGGETLVIDSDGPGRDPLRIPMAPEGPSTDVVVWDDRCPAVVVGKAADTWFSALLERPVRLVFMAADTHRVADPTYAKPGSTVSFADGFPFLLTTEASLSDLNARMDVNAPLGMDRFRPNLVIGGAEAWDEDGWTSLQVGDLTLDVVKPCARCSITTTDQATAKRGKEPLRTLATFRRTARGDVLFGQNLVHRGTGRLRVGDPVQVLGTNAKPRR